MSRFLLTGGTGKTSSRIARRLLAAGHEVRLASRRTPPDGHSALQPFSWNDSRTFANAVAGCEAIYLLAPTDTPRSLDSMRPFIDFALEAGVPRYVLLSASSLPKGGAMMGEVHAYLEAHAPQWAALRPTWFMQNFSEQQHLATIRNEGVIYSATGEGRVPFIDAEDIAAMAVEALTRHQSFNRDVLLTGPQALTYSEVAAIISRVTSRRVQHHALSERALIDRFIASGMPEAYALTLAAMDTRIAEGAEDRLSTEQATLIGISPTRFDTFANHVRQVWLPD